ncbi:MAG: Mrp/NBP35 family ATP-binding protein [Oscillospiraceae bacterium]
MSESCNNNCSECGSSCEDRKAPQDFKVNPHKDSHIKKVIGVVSGKGGVGKSMVTSLLAVNLKRRGRSIAIMDADITGPSIPKAFGIHERATGTDTEMYPVVSKSGIKVMSLNLLVENETDPVVWRGPVIAGTVKQFWTDVVWGDVDYMFVDLPPGTGDVPLTVFQSMPVDGIIIVASPQELVAMIVEKAANMANMMNIPILGLVENMSYVECPDCGKRIHVFGESRADETAKLFDIGTVSKMPIVRELAAACDDGEIEHFTGGWLDNMAAMLERM